MADFKTHITASSVVGVGYGVAGYFLVTDDVAACLLAAGLCSVAGIMPDLDSGSGRPVREMSAFLAAAVPVLAMERLQALGLSHETMAAVAITAYLVIRFGVPEFFKRYTVHRGMWHSLPAALTVTLLAYLVVSSADPAIRVYKALAVGLGFMVHLILDEIWSVDLYNVRIKKSFGTAIKLWSDSRWANISTYAKLFVLLVMGSYDPFLMDQLGAHGHGVPLATRKWLNELAPQLGFLKPGMESGPTTPEGEVKSGAEGDPAAGPLAELARAGRRIQAQSLEQLQKRGFFTQGEASSGPTTSPGTAGGSSQNNPLDELSRLGHELQTRGIEELEKQGILPSGATMKNGATAPASQSDPVAELSRMGRALQAQGIEELEKRGIMPSGGMNPGSSGGDSPAPFISEAKQELRSFLAPFTPERSATDTTGSPAANGEPTWLRGKAKLIERPSFLSRPVTPPTDATR